MPSFFQRSSFPAASRRLIITESCGIQRAPADDGEYDEEAVDNRREERMPRLGMAARSILKSVPDSVLKALEQQQVEADTFNKQAKVQSSLCV